MGIYEGNSLVATTAKKISEEARSTLEHQSPAGGPIDATRSRGTKADYRNIFKSDA